MNRLVKTLLVLLLLLNALFFTQTTSAQCHIDDWTALQAFVKSTKGFVLDDFNWELIPYSLLDTTLTAPPSNCDLDPYFTLDNQGRVSELTIAGGGSSGFIPSEIGKLTNLKQLFISSWPSLSITGIIPPELGNLSNLTSLNLAENSLEACFDENLSLLCDQLINPVFSYPSQTESNNNFEASWEDFCETGKGECKEFSVVEAQPEIETEEGDVYIKESLHGVILRSENGLCFRVTVKNDGTLITNNVRCP